MNLDSIYLLGVWIEFLKRGCIHQYPVKLENWMYDGLDNVERYINDIGMNGAMSSYIKRIRMKLDKYKEKEEINADDCDYVKNRLARMESLIHRELAQKILFESISECTLDSNCLVKLMDKKKICIFRQTYMETII